MRNRFKLKIINISFILFLLASNAKAQTYFPLPDSNATWNVGWYISSYNYPLRTKIFAVKGDTIHNSVVYKKYFIVNDTNLSTAQFVYFAMVRQDIPNKKVYGILNGYASEKLLYKFNVNVNDTFSVSALDFGYGFTLKVKVLAKDSVLINSQYRKRITLNGYYMSYGPEYWIEGIGSSFGILNPGGSGYPGTDQCVPELMCQKQNGILNYVNPSCITCFDDKCFPVGIQELSSNDNFKIYPNPIKDKLTIELKEQTNGKLEIYNAMGQLVFSYLLSNPKEELDLKFLQNGMYSVKIQSNSEQKIFKIIKE